VVVATFRKRGKAWRVELYVKGKRRSASFPTKAEAAGWAMRQEAELSGKDRPVHAMSEALRKYADEVSPEHRGERWERLRLAVIERTWPKARQAIGDVTGADVAAWRDARSGEVSAASVAREMTLLRCVFESARRDWGWIDDNPMRDVRRPREPPSRKRRVMDDEIDAMIAALGYRRGDVPETQSQRVAVAFLLAIETAMRAGEILGLTWADVREKAVRLPRTKNGDVRDVPLSPAARALLALLPRGGDAVIDVKPALRDALFRKARSKAVECVPSVASLHFHDSRAEAIWRLSKKLDVLDLARIIGHRDLKSLLIYYRASADDLADKL
jgi:integrase